MQLHSSLNYAVLLSIWSPDCAKDDKGPKRFGCMVQQTVQLLHQLTEGRPDGEDDRISRLLDEVDDVLVVHVGDVHSVHCHDPIPDV